MQRITPMAWSPLAAGLLADGAKQLLPAQETYRPQRFLPTLDGIATHPDVRLIAVAEVDSARLEQVRKKYPQALAAMQLAYDNGLLTDSSEIMRLFDLLLNLLC